MDPWSPTGSRTNVASIQESPQTALQSPCGISFSSLPPIPDERRGGKNGKLALSPYLEEPLKLSNHILRQWKDARLAELRASAYNPTSPNTNITPHHPKY